MTPRAKAGQARRSRKYYKSDKAKAKRKARREALLECNRRAAAKYAKSEKAKLRRKKYKQSEKGKAANRRYKLRLEGKKKRDELGLKPTTDSELDAFVSSFRTKSDSCPSDGPSSGQSSVGGRPAARRSASSGYATASRP